MTIELKVYSIPEVNFPTLEAKLAKLNKKAEKLNCEPIVLTLVETIDRKESGQIVRYNQVTITGVAPIIAGWELIASCEGMEHGVLIRSVPEKTYPEKYRDMLVCEHCNSDRKRKYTFIVRNVESNEYKMVGKSCLKDFLGHVDPNFIAEILQYISDFKEEDYGELPENFKPRTDTGYYLTFVAACIRESGWMSRTKANEEGVPSTANLASEAMENFGKIVTDYRGNILEYPIPTDQDKELASKAHQWAKDLTDTTNDYLYNINLLAHESSITYKEYGFVASIVSSFTRHIEREIEKEMKATAKKQELISDYVGEIGQKIQIELKFVACHSFETQWGTTDILKFLDAEGNVFIWKTSTSQLIEQGQKVKIKGTIKDHSEYAGAKQTILTRCKIA